MKFQLCTRDEYGTSNIVSTSEDVNKLILDGKKEVHGINMDNALSLDEQIRNYEAYFVEISSGNESYLYGGTDGHGKHVCYNSKMGLLPLEHMLNLNIRFYIGTNKSKDIFAQNEKKKEITDISDASLRGKVVYFIKKI